MRPLHAAFAIVVLILAPACSGGGGSDPDTGPDSSGDVSPLDLPGEADEADALEPAPEPLPEVVEDAPDLPPEVPEVADAEVRDAGIPCTGDATCLGLLGHAPDECGTARCKQGACVFDLAPDITPCGALDPCRARARCVSGVCRVDLAKPLVCDDGNPCTKDACVEGACVFTPLAAFCDDGDPCTVQDRCVAGRCRGNAAAGCACLGDADCADHQPADPCADPLVCQEGRCRVDRAAHPRCAAQPAPPCKRWACDADSGVCELDDLADDTPCDDGNPCTIQDKCFFGDCFGVNLCPACQSDEGCAAYDDGNPCNGRLACTGGECVTAPGSRVLCGDPLGNPCTHRACDPATGACADRAAYEGAACLDGDACTSGETCAHGLCGGGTSRSCDDGNPCTADLCESGLGCLHQNLKIACDDGNPCTQGERCQAGMCLTADLAECDDRNPCTDDLCGVEGGCQFVPNELPCDDGNPCTGGDTCAEGACVAGADVCGACDSDVDCDPFDDANLCNGLLRCLDGLCLVDPVTVVACPVEQDSFCLQNRCDPGSAACKMTPVHEGQACDDGDPCTDDDACVLGACTGRPRACEDGNPCTDDACDPAGGCQHTPSALACDDRNPCTGGDTCADGACVPGVHPLCGQACAGDADCAALDDGDPCTGLVHCLVGLCTFDPASVVVCPSQGESACRRQVCQSETGTCALTNLPDGATCNDEDPCTTPDTCTAGFCSGPPVECEDGNPCTSDSCSVFYGCVHFFNEKACSDDNACTVGDRCREGWCLSGTAADCDDDNVCTEDACDPALGCVHTDIGLEWCDDDQLCTADVCDPIIGCTYEVICPEYCANHIDDDLDGKIDCQDPDCQLDPGCTGEGQCTAIAPLVCDGEALTGDLSGEGARDKMFAYGCTFLDYKGPEITYELTPSCNAKVTLLLEETVEGGSPQLDLFAIPDTSGLCAASLCPAYGYAAMQFAGGAGQAQLIFNAQAQKKHYIVVDGRDGQVGTFRVAASCTCI